MTFAKARMAERLNDIKIQKALGVPDPEKPINGNRRGDLLTMFLKAKNERPGFFNDARVLTMAVSMAFAGSETTAISLAAVFYYLLKNPRRYEKLVKEIDDAVEAGQIENRPDGIVSWSESQTLPYLDACIKEAFRLHPAPGLVLERIVPPEGANICGESIPGGTIVGCNPWVIHRRPEIFGADVEKFRPERWIEADKEQKKMMDSSMLHFSMGARTCIGKNISLLEMYKIIPAFLRRFEVRHSYPYTLSLHMKMIHVLCANRGLRFDWRFQTKNGNYTMHGLSSNTTSTRPSRLGSSLPRGFGDTKVICT